MSYVFYLVLYGEANRLALLAQMDMMAGNNIANVKTSALNALSKAIWHTTIAKEYDKFDVWKQLT